MGRIQAVLCGYYGFDNGGDEALLATLLQMLPPHVMPLVLSGNPQATEQLHGVPAYDRMSPRIWSLFRTADVFIWGGGSLIQDATSVLSPVYYAALMGWAQGLGLTTIAWAQGIGPLNRASTRWLARRAFQGCAAISLRDRTSASLVQAWQQPYTLAPDPVWALAAQPTDHLQALPAPRIAVVLRAHPQLTPLRLECLTRALVQVQDQTQATILLLPFQPTSDLEIAASIHAQLQGPSCILQIKDPRELKGVFQGVELAITMRLHGLIMAAAEGCRCCAISYDPKVRRVMEDIRCPGWDLDQLPCDPRAIAQAWLTQFTQGQGLSAEAIRDRVNQALTHQQLLHQVLMPPAR